MSQSVNKEQTVIESNISKICRLLLKYDKEHMVQITRIYICALIFTHFKKAGWLTNYLSDLT